MREVVVGVHVRGEPERLRATLASLERTTGTLDDVVILADGPDAATMERVDALGLPVSATPAPRGAPACFNRLVTAADAEVFVLLENGSVAATAAIDRLVAAVHERSVHGLAGPSTNRSWNEQGAFPGAPDDLPAIERTGRRAYRRFGRATRRLTPLHSLADFCLAVRRDVVCAVGAADEGFGPGPYWEMQYSARAARAGFLGVWVCAAYVHRMALTAGRAREEAGRCEASRRYYQDTVCGLRLRGARGGDDYESHCRGEDCEQFAPADLLRIHRPLPARQSVRAAVTRRPPATTAPAGELVTCVMPTRDRARFALQSVRYFLRQDYPARELIVVDDGSDGLEDDLPGDPRIRYERVPPGLSIGAKRNRGCALARGSIVAQWDDDDWYAADRLSVQVAAVLADRADITGLTDPLFLDLERWQGWRASDALLRRMFRPVNVHGGTLVFRRSVWGRLARYPAVSLAEDAAFLRSALHRGARMQPVAAGNHYAYVRHPRNSWPFQVGAFLDPAGWRRVPQPALPDEDLAFYLAMRTGYHDSPAAGPGPLVSCVMPTRDRRPFVAQAISYFSRQDYADRELVVVDDGEDPVGDLVPPDPRIRYVRLERPLLLGAKRNLCNDLAAGDILIHWDDDDWSAPDRLRRQVTALQTTGADLCGLSDQLYYEPLAERAWRYTYSPRRGWVAGNTLCYRRARWRRHPFAPIAVGEDTRFVWAVADPAPAELSGLFHVGIIHPTNSAAKPTSGAGWCSEDVTTVHRVLGEDLSFYRSLAAGHRSPAGHQSTAAVNRSLPARTAVS